MANVRYDVPTLLEIMEDLKSPSMYLFNQFTEEGQTFDTQEVEVRTYKGNTPVAPYVSELQEGKVLMRPVGQAETYRPATLKPARIITHVDIQVQSVYENVLNPLSPIERAQQMLAQDIIDLKDSIDRAQIQQVVQLLFTGKITQKGEGIDQQLDYGFQNKMTLSGTDLWDNPDSKPIEKLAQIRRMLMMKNVPTPNVVLGDYDSMVALTRHPDVLALADNNGLDIGRIDITNLPDGVTYHGYLRDPGVDLYSYTGMYSVYDQTLNDGKGGYREEEVMPKGNIVVYNSAQKFRWNYGSNLIMNSEAEQFQLVRGKYCPESWVKKQPAARWLQIQSKPLLVPRNIEGWYVVKVLSDAE